MNVSNTHDHYQQTISVKTTPEQAYAALTSGYQHWWTAVDQAFDQVGDQIKFTFAPNVSYWTFEAMTLEPNHLIVLKCIDAYHVMPDKPGASTTEWLGSVLRWQINENRGQTDIHLTHDGLTPELDCYDVCQAGWNMYFIDSLSAYLETGLGTPHRG